MGARRRRATSPAGCVFVLASLLASLLVSSPAATFAADKVPAAIEASVPATVAIGGIADISGTLRLGGALAPEQRVDWLAVCDDGFEIPTRWGSLTTDANGSFAFTFDPGRCARMRLKFSNVSTQTVEGVVAGPYVITVPWHRYAVTVDGPLTVAAGDSYDATLTTTRDGQLAAGVPLTVIVTAPNGVRTDLSGTTGDDGTLQVHATTSVASTYRLSATTHDTSDTLRGGTELQTQAEDVIVETNHPVYPAGEVATIEVSLTGTQTRAVNVTAKRADGTITTLFTGSLPAGGLVLQRRTRYTETITASTAADPNLAALSGSARVVVRSAITATPRNPWRILRGIPSYRAQSFAPLDAVIIPRRAALCLRFEAQRYTASGWRPVQRSACRNTDYRGEASWRFGGQHGTRGLYRIRATFAGDNLNASGHSSWKRLRFVPR